MKRKFKIKSHVLWSIISGLLVGLLFLRMYYKNKANLDPVIGISLTVGFAGIIFALSFFILSPEKPDKPKHKKDTS